MNQKIAVVMKTIGGDLKIEPGHDCIVLDLDKSTTFLTKPEVQRLIKELKKQLKIIEND